MRTQSASPSLILLPLALLICSVSSIPSSNLVSIGTVTKVWCSGVLAAPQLVITTRECLYRQGDMPLSTVAAWNQNNSGKTPQITPLTVSFGAISMTAHTGTSGERVNVTRFILPSSSSTTFIGLVLQSPQPVTRPRWDLIFTDSLIRSTNVTWAPVWVETDNTTFLLQRSETTTFTATWSSTSAETLTTTTAAALLIQNESNGTLVDYMTTSVPSLGTGLYRPNVTTGGSYTAVGLLGLNSTNSTLAVSATWEAVSGTDTARWLWDAARLHPLRALAVVDAAICCSSALACSCQSLNTSLFTNARRNVSRSTPGFLCSEITGASAAAACPYQIPDTTTVLRVRADGATGDGDSYDLVLTEICRYGTRIMPTATTTNTTNTTNSSLVTSANSSWSCVARGSVVDDDNSSGGRIAISAAVYPATSPDGTVVVAKALGNCGGTCGNASGVVLAGLSQVTWSCGGAAAECTTSNGVGATTVYVQAVGCQSADTTCCAMALSQILGASGSTITAIEQCDCGGVSFNCPTAVIPPSTPLNASAARGSCGVECPTGYPTNVTFNGTSLRLGCNLSQCAATSRYQLTESAAETARARGGGGGGGGRGRWGGRGDGLRAADKFPLVTLSGCNQPNANDRQLCCTYGLSQIFCGKSPANFALNTCYCGGAYISCPTRCPNSGSQSKKGLLGLLALLALIPIGFVCLIAICCLLKGRRDKTRRAADTARDVAVYDQPADGEGTAGVEVDQVAYDHTDQQVDQQVDPFGGDPVTGDTPGGEYHPDPVDAS